MSECTGYQNNFMQPKSSVFHAELPPPLKPDGGVFYSAGLDIWACKQALIDNEAVDNVDLAFFYTLISNPDSKTRTDSYILLLTVYSNSSVFVEAAQRHGLNVTLAPHFGDESRTPTAENVDYTTFAYPSDSKDFIFRGAVDHTAASDWSATLAVYYVSAGKIRRILWSEEGKIDTANEGMMEFGPGSYWAKHSRANHIDDSVNYQTRTAITFGFDNRWTMNSTASD